MHKREKVITCSSSEVKTFCSAKDLGRWMERPVTEREEIFVNHIPNKRLLSGLQKERPKLTGEKGKYTGRKGVKDRKRDSSTGCLGSTGHITPGEVQSEPLRGVGHTCRGGRGHSSDSMECWQTCKGQDKLLCELFVRLLNVK